MLTSEMPNSMLNDMSNSMQNKIIISGLRIYAYHGVMEQERKVGAYFTIDLDVETDFTHAIESDDLSGTVSYADLFETIRREMSLPSSLLEHVAGRIAKAILQEYPTAQSVRLRLLKENPPMGADCKGAGVEIFIERETQNNN
jgi:dihydroneopterin aldolase